MLCTVVCVSVCAKLHKFRREKSSQTRPEKWHLRSPRAAGPEKVPAQERKQKCFSSEKYSRLVHKFSPYKNLASVKFLRSLDTSSDRTFKTGRQTSLDFHFCFQINIYTGRKSRQLPALRQQYSPRFEATIIINFTFNKFRKRGLLAKPKPT